VQNDDQFFQSDLAKTLGLQSMVAVPILALDPREAPVGCITAYTISADDRLGTEHAGLLEDIARFVTVALGNLRASLLLKAHVDTSDACRNSARSQGTLDGICE